MRTHSRTSPTLPGRRTAATRCSVWYVVAPADASASLAVTTWAGPSADRQSSSAAARLTPSLQPPRLGGAQPPGEHREQLVRQRGHLVEQGGEVELAENEDLHRA